MSENDLLEMADDFKKRIELKNKEIKNLKYKLRDSRKDFLFAYGEIRNLDIIFAYHDIGGLIPVEIIDLINTLRGKLSSLLDCYIMADVGGFDSDSD